MVAIPPLFLYNRGNKHIYIMIYFVEVPNKGIQEPVRSLDDAYPICYDFAQEFGFAEVCWYALNGKRVTEGSYSDKD